MTDLLQAVERSNVREVVILLDCCHSGRFGEAPFLGGASVLKEGVSVLTASRRDEPAMEEEGVGVFTELICDALEGGAADVLGTVTLAGVYAYLDEALGAWDQRPLFKSHVSRLTPCGNVTRQSVAKHSASFPRGFHPSGLNSRLTRPLSRQWGREAPRTKPYSRSSKRVERQTSSNRSEHRICTSRRWSGSRAGSLRAGGCTGGSRERIGFEGTAPRPEDFFAASRAGA
jgi:hypothetical protein